MFDIRCYDEDSHYIFTKNKTYRFSKTITELDQVYVKIVSLRYNYNSYGNLTFGLTFNGEIYNVMTNFKINLIADNIYTDYKKLFILSGIKLYIDEFKLEHPICVAEDVKEIYFNDTFAYYINFDNKKFIITNSSNYYVNIFLGLSYRDYIVELPEDILDIKIINEYVLFYYINRIVLVNINDSWFNDDYAYLT